MAKRVLKATDIERLENTSIASALVAAAGLPFPQAPAYHDASCAPNGTFCVSAYATALNCQVGTVVCNGSVVVPTFSGCIPQTPHTPPTGGLACVCPNGQTVAPQTLRNCPSQYCCANTANY